MQHIKQVFEISERRACKAVGQPRATQRFKGRRAELDRELLGRMKSLAHENPTFGYRTPAEFAIDCANLSVASAAAQLRPSYTPGEMDTTKAIETAA